ncbi:MAG: ABC transporter permease [Gemmatimonadota bacterium]|nr:ABC transporter permease [Gemmatimonadota bacterium]
MTHEPAWRRYLRFLGPDPAADLDDELEYHLERRVEEYVTRGMDPEAARREAARRVGDLDAVRRECGDIASRSRRDRGRREWLDARTTEVRQGARRLRRRPGFAFAAALTLALGIGATASIFAVVNGVILTPLAFDDPDPLVSVNHTAPGLGFEEVFQADATYFTYRTHNTTLEDLALWTPERVSVTGEFEPRVVPALGVTDGLLPLLRVRPVAGRIFLPSDDSPGAPGTIMLGARFWREAFAEDPGIVGRTLDVNGVPREVIGVLPAGFSILDNRPDVLYPLRLDPATARLTNFSYDGLGRLRPGRDPEDVASELTALIPTAQEENPRGMPPDMLAESGLAAVVTPLKDEAVGGVRRVLWTLFGTVAVVLLIAWANVAGLFMVRGEGQQQEVAVRAALGAGRRAARGMLVESWLLGLVGGLLGVGLAWAGVRLLIALGPEALPRLDEIGVTGEVVAFALALAVISATVLGLLTVRRFGRPELNVALRDAGRGGGAGRSRQRLRSALVVSQMALALVLLVGAGLMVRSLGALRDVHPGFEDPSGVLTFEIAIPASEVSEPEDVAPMFERLLESVAAVPGVESASRGAHLPLLGGLRPEDIVLLEDFPDAPGAAPKIHRTKWIAGDYFETMGNPVLAGRPITWADVRSRANVVVITEDVALRYWGDARSAVGRRLRNEPDVEWREIVGVVGPVHDDGPDQDPVGIVYWPQQQTGFWGNELYSPRRMSFVLRMSGTSPSGAAGAVRSAIWGLNANLPVANLRTLEDIVRESVSRTSFTVVMLATAAAVALLLGVIGLYGVVSYAVATRTREIGVRIALGARRREVIGMVVGQGTRLTVLGLAIGLVGALVATRILSTLLFGVRTVDPPTYAATAAVLGVVAVLASYLPARRASRIEPTEALRHE